MLNNHEKKVKVTKETPQKLREHSGEVKKKEAVDKTFYYPTLNQTRKKISKFFL